MIFSTSTKLTLQIAVITSVVISIYSNTAIAEDASHKWSQEIGFYTIDPDEDSSEISGPGLPPGTAADVDDGSSFVLTTSYHHSENLYFEVFYSTANELDVFADGSIAALGTVGTIEYLAPTVTANWVFGDSSWMARPYVGIGLNRMIYINEESNATLQGALGGPTDVNADDTWGLAFTAGVTVDFSERVYATASYLQIGTDTTITLSTPAVGTERTVDLDADLKISYLSLGYRF